MKGIVTMFSINEKCKFKIDGSKIKNKSKSVLKLENLIKLKMTISRH